jgi:transitional endoplasmic reticulum ATPase
MLTPDKSNAEHSLHGSSMKKKMKQTIPWEQKIVTGYLLATGIIFCCQLILRYFSVFDQRTWVMILSQSSVVGTFIALFIGFIYQRYTSRLTRVFWSSLLGLTAILLGFTQLLYTLKNQTLSSFPLEIEVRSVTIAFFIILSLFSYWNVDPFKLKSLSKWETVGQFLLEILITIGVLFVCTLFFIQIFFYWQAIATFALLSNFEDAQIINKFRITRDKKIALESIPRTFYLVLQQRLLVSCFNTIILCCVILVGIFTGGYLDWLASILLIFVFSFLYNISDVNLFTNRFSNNLKDYFENLFEGDSSSQEYAEAFKSLQESQSSMSSNTWLMNLYINFFLSKLSKPQGSLQEIRLSDKTALPSKRVQTGETVSANQQDDKQVAELPFSNYLSSLKSAQVNGLFVGLSGQDIDQLSSNEMMRMIAEQFSLTASPQIITNMDNALVLYLPEIDLNQEVNLKDYIKSLLDTKLIEIQVFGYEQLVTSIQQLQQLASIKNTEATSTNNSESNVQEAVGIKQIIEQFNFERFFSIQSKQRLRLSSDRKFLYKTSVSLKEAVSVAYAEEIADIAAVLSVGLSALVRCDKIIVEWLWQEIINQSTLKQVILEVSDLGEVQSSLLQYQLGILKSKIEKLKKNEVLVVPHLDLLAGGSAIVPTDLAREFIELVYRKSDCPILAFTDISLDIPEVLASRFSTRRMIAGMPRTIQLEDKKELPLAQALVTEEEAALFSDFDSEGLYKNISGMNPIQFRHAIAYAKREFAQKQKVSMKDLYQAIRTFKATSSASFEIPNVDLENDIGGYEELKQYLEQSIAMMQGMYNLPSEALRRELAPRGFIFHGPPGTGKTLFAKAIANLLNATVLVVSGPEVIDMYVGESERKIREIFANARRNAPAVIVFDEFDAIAGKRSSHSDGGARVGNAVVAQLLTEMDGFRADVQILVVGTTNRIDILDEALLRPNRFQAVHIDLPDPAARRKICEIHANKFEITEYISSKLLDIIAEKTDGFNGDEIRSIFREAAFGWYCNQVPITPQRLGQLVGQVRLSRRRKNALSTRGTSSPVIRVVRDNSSSTPFQLSAGANVD